MRIPLSNSQALGRKNILAQNKSKNLPFISMGQIGPTIGSDEIAYRDSVRNVEGIKKAYPLLLELLGQSAADQIVSEAKLAVEQAQAEYLKSIPQK